MGPSLLRDSHPEPHRLQVNTRRPTFDLPCGWQCSTGGQPTLWSTWSCQIPAHRSSTFLSWRRTRRPAKSQSTHRQALQSCGSSSRRYPTAQGKRELRIVHKDAKVKWKYLDIASSPARPIVVTSSAGQIYVGQRGLYGRPGATSLHSTLLMLCCMTSPQTSLRR
jgi:hypothetical protein